MQPQYLGACWGKIASATIQFYEAMRQFILKPTVKNYKTQGRLGNKLSMLVHNGDAGPLTKFGNTMGIVLPSFLDMMLGFPAKPTGLRGLPRVRDTYSAWRNKKVITDNPYKGLSQADRTFECHWQTFGRGVITYIHKFLPNHYIALCGSFGFYSSSDFKIICINMNATWPSGFVTGTGIYFDEEGHLHLLDRNNNTCAVITPRGKDTLISGMSMATMYKHSGDFSSLLGLLEFESQDVADYIKTTISEQDNDED